ncbi:hypothetical protein [Streptomyces lacrimifluminis]|uniref:hypothetical protein n=1 Tax=Streptomyces lacrimifluminis TaxID=1500077 RepID=UPI00166BC419|nr:hypothetical protein [Streptomyces lacrimifluminis]
MPATTARPMITAYDRSRTRAARTLSTRISASERVALAIARGEPTSTVWMAGHRLDVGTHGRQKPHRAPCNALLGG